MKLIVELMPPISEFSDACWRVSSEEPNFLQVTRNHMYVDEIDAKTGNNAFHEKADG